MYADVAPGSEARAGMYATGRIAIGEQPALAVVAEAVTLRDGRTYVFELADGASALTEGAFKESNPKEVMSKVLLRAVEVGRRKGAEIEIVSGLAENALIVVHGTGFLNDGDLVRVVDSEPPPAAPSPAKGGALR